MGKRAAELMEGVDNLQEDRVEDRYLIGGGELAISILSGSLPGSGKSKNGNTKISVNSDSSGAGHSNKGGGSVGGAKDVSTVIEPKIDQQMSKRGWSADEIDLLILSPHRTVATKDTRFDPVTGSRLNDPATGYIEKDGSYVVRNDRTGL